MNTSSNIVTQAGAGASSSEALSVQNLKFRYGQSPSSPYVLNDISLDIHDGEFVAVMGPSGCGKSTLLSIVAGFDKPESGDVRCYGEPVTKASAERGVVFQRPTLYPWLNVLENATFGLRARGVEGDINATAREMLAEVGLAGYEEYKPYELSGGMQQRVALARTLVNEPRLLLMDEPFAALDAQTRTVMQQLVLDVREKHKSSVLFVTHDIEEGLLLADRVIVLGANPSRIQEIVTVDLPRPRSYEVVLTDAFVELRHHLLDLMRH